MSRVRHVKKGDTVKVLSGADKSKVAKVLAVKQSTGQVQVEGVAVYKKHMKPTQKNPKGGITEMNRWIAASKVQVADANGKALGRVGFVIKGDKKERIFSSQRS